MPRLAALCLVLGTVLAAPVGLAAEPALVVIIHPTRTEPLTLVEIGRIFLRKRRFWSDGTPIIPLNQRVDSLERRLFTERVFGGDGRFLGQYWNEQYFAGVFPPTVLSSAAAVRRYVAADRDAIGYLIENEADDSIRVAITLGPEK